MEAETLDLAVLADPLARSTRWRTGVPTIFEGLRVTMPRKRATTGRIATYGFGPGRIAGIEGGAQRVTRVVTRADRSSGTFNVLIQIGGSCALTHAGSTILMNPGTFSLIDGAAPFELSFPDTFRQILVQFPRDVVVRRYPSLSAMTGTLFDRTSSLPGLVFDVISASAKNVEALSAEARSRAFEACLAMLGVLYASREPSSADRFEQAAADIEAELSDPSLDARSIAARQSLSRRHLDTLFRAHGTTVNEWIWERRLARIASELADRGMAHRKITDIAFSYGFSDAAHFSRAFRRRMGVSPSTYRKDPSSAAPFGDRARGRSR